MKKYTHFVNIHTKEVERNFSRVQKRVRFNQIPESFWGLISRLLFTQ